MTSVETNKNLVNKSKINLFKDYNWFYENFYNTVQEAITEFFEKEIKLRFMGICGKENIFFYGDEYFGNKIPTMGNGNFTFKISASAVEYLLDTALGKSNNKFKLQNLTDIEERLIKSLTVFICRKINKNLNKIEPTRKEIINSKDYNFTFFVKGKYEHKGKIIITMPSFLLPDFERNEEQEMFTIDDFTSTKAIVDVGVGKSKISLRDLKNIEDGDVIILENSDINEMFIIHNKNNISFTVEPNTSLIMDVYNDGDNSMEETSINSSNMWDTILVDVVAEFDNIKMSLGDLKQISEGLVIDVGSVYENKVNLKVENQVVASGELVIINDRYGVRIDSVKKSESENSSKIQENTVYDNQDDDDFEENNQEIETENEDDDESFDYSDFEVEDENI